MILVATVLLAPISPARAEPGDAGASGPSALDALGGGLAFGGWSDSVPLELPPAPRGMVPELGLTIDFRVDEGWMGASMALSGFSRIDLRSQTGGVPQLDGQDVPWVDGERLWVEGGANWAAEQDDDRNFSFDGTANVWVAERDGWTWTWGPSADGQCAVERRDEEADWDCAHPPTPDGNAEDVTTSWLLTRIEDPFGNSIVTTYTTGANELAAAAPELFDAPDEYAHEHVPKAVAYANGYHRVDFVWEVRGDIPTSARSGTLRANLLRLVRIEVVSNVAGMESGRVADDPSATYALVYSDVADEEPCRDADDDDVDDHETAGELSALAGSGRSLVHRIVRREDRDAGVVYSDLNEGRTLRCIERATEETTFASVPAVSFTGTHDGLAAAATRQHQEVNFDGDASPDLLYLSTECTNGGGAELETVTGCAAVEWQYFENQEGVLSEPAAASAPEALVWLETNVGGAFFGNQGAWVALDLDRDGRTELLTATQDTGDDWQRGVMYRGDEVGTWTEGEWLANVSGLPSSASELLRHAQWADIDADGFVDLVMPVVDHVDLFDDGVTPTTTRWLRNAGAEPFFDLDELADLPTPMESDPVLLPSEWADLLSECGTDGAARTWPQGSFIWGPGNDRDGTPDPEDTATMVVFDQSNDRFTGLDFDSFEHYVSAQARWGDYNDDGAADVAYALYGCWRDPTTPAYDDEFGPLDVGYSTIFYGDGRGSFSDSHTSAGPPFLAWSTDFPDGWSAAYAEKWTRSHPGWRTASTFATVDLGDAGRTGLLTACIGTSCTNHDIVYERAGVGLTAGVQSTGVQLPLPLLSLAQPDESYEQLLADWDGDGFTDALVHDRGGTGPALAEGLYENERTVAMYRPTVIHGPWGGETLLTYAATSASVGVHPRLPHAVDVIASVSDQNGTTEFSFSNGVFWGAEARFMGFRDVVIDRESGSVTNARFVQAPWGAGKLAWRIERRADGTIARVSQNRYGAESPHIQSWDTLAPLYNPLVHACEVDVDAGTGTWPNRSQSLTVEGLIVPCEMDGNASTAATDGRYFDAMGWSYGTANGAVSDALKDQVWTLEGDDTVDPGSLAYTCAAGSCSWSPQGSSMPLAPPGPGPGPLGGGPPLSPPVFSGGPMVPPVGPPLGGGSGAGSGSSSAPEFSELEWPGITDEVESVSTPDWVYDSGSATTDTRMYARRWWYNSAHRLAFANNDGDVDEPQDDSLVAYVYNSAGARTAATVFGPTSTWERTDTFGSFVGFDTPETIVQVARDGGGTGGTIGRTVRRTYDAAGGVSSSTDGEGHLTSTTNDACGQATSTVDAVGRTELRSYDAACRPVSWSLEGASRAWTYDDYGRVATLATNPGSSGTQMSQSWLRDDDLARVDDREAGSRDEPRLGVLDSGGGLRLTYLDPWGREFASVACENAGAGTSSVSDVLDEVSCDSSATATTQPVYALRAYALDGSLRFVSGPFYGGDTVVGSWTFLDELGRPRFAYAPAPDVLADFVETDFAYGLGYATVTDPLGLSCTQESTTLSSERSCAGVARGSEETDALGRVVSSMDPAGESWAFAYDGWGRLIERVAPSIVTTTGTVTPAWTIEYDDDDRPTLTTAPDGTTSTTSFDAAHRPEARWVDGASMSPLQVDAWGYTAASSAVGPIVVHDDANGRRTVTSLDGLGRPLVTLHPDALLSGQSYGANGAVASATDIDGLTTSFDYDALGRLLSQTDEAGEVRTYTWAANGQLDSETDRDGVLTEHVYTFSGQLSATYRGGFTLVDREYRDDGQVVLAVEGGVTSSFGYDSLARKDEACVGYDPSSSNPCAVEFAWTYDDRDRIETETQGTSTWTYSYNALGWLTTKQLPDGNSESWSYFTSGKVAEYTDPSNLVSTWAYDDLGRPTTESLPHQGVTSFAYTLDADADHHEQVTRSEPDGGEWDQYIDHRGRTIRSIDPLGDEVLATFVGTQLRQVDYVEGSTGTPIASEAYAYDSMGRVATRCGPSDDPTCVDGGAFSPSTVYGFEYSYSAEGRLTEREGYNDRTAWLYNIDGTLHAEVIEGVTTEVYTYATDYPRIEGVQAGDSVDVRTTSRTYFRGLWLQEEEIVETGNPDGVLRTFGSWDAFGSPRAAERWVGASLEAEYVSTTDALGRLSGLSASTATGFNETVTWGYEANSALSTIGTSWAGSLTYTRDATTGLVDNVASGTGTLATVMSRDVMGRPEDIALAGGAAITSTWDVLGRVQERTTRSTAGDEQTRAWNYDSRGRTESQLTYENGLLTQTINYSFAEPGWLLSEERVTATDINSTEYDYDVGGNRTEKREVNQAGAIVSTQTYGYAWGNELTDVSGAAVTWNAFGEVTTDHRGLDILRDADGLEWGIGTPVGIRHVITRDAFGTPVAVDADGDDTTANVRAQMWGPSLSDAPVAGVDGSGDGVMTVAIDGIAVGRLEGGAFVAMGTDKNGSVVMDGLEMLADAGAFGEHAVAAAGSHETRVYAGLDSLVGTAYQLPRRRFYDSELGRFTSIDPSGLAGGEHRFLYTSNNPVDFVDPSGLEEERPEGDTGSTEGTDKPMATDDEIAATGADRPADNTTPPDDGQTGVCRDCAFAEGTPVSPTQDGNGNVAESEPGVAGDGDSQGKSDFFGGEIARDAGGGAGVNVTERPSGGSGTKDALDVDLGRAAADIVIRQLDRLRGETAAAQAGTIEGAYRALMGLPRLVAADRTGEMMDEWNRWLFPDSSIPSRGPALAEQLVQAADDAYHKNSAPVVEQEIVIARKFLGEDETTRRLAAAATTTEVVLAAPALTKAADDVLAKARAGLAARLQHIFGQSKHALDDFVAASGGREQAFARIQEAANTALAEGKLVVGPNGILPKGDAGNIINVGGTDIRLIGGRVVDGAVEISSASRLGLP